MASSSRPSSRSKETPDEPPEPPRPDSPVRGSTAQASSSSAASPNKSAGSGTLPGTVAPGTTDATLKPIDPNAVSGLVYSSLPKERKDASVLEMLEYVKVLNIHPTKDSDMLWIAEEAFNTSLPPGWTQHQDEQGKTYFHCAATRESEWRHPMDDLFHDVVGYQRRVVESGGFWEVEDELAKLEESIESDVADWMELFDDQGEKFYYNRRTEESRFDDPRMAVYHSFYARMKMVAKMKERLPLLAVNVRPSLQMQEGVRLRMEDIGANGSQELVLSEVKGSSLAARDEEEYKAEAGSVEAAAHTVPQPVRGQMRLRMEKVGADGSHELVLSEATARLQEAAAAGDPSAEEDVLRSKAKAALTSGNLSNAMIQVKDAALTKTAANDDDEVVAAEASKAGTDSAEATRKEIVSATGATANAQSEVTTDSDGFGTYFRQNILPCPTAYLQELHTKFLVPGSRAAAAAEVQPKPPAVLAAAAAKVQTKAPEALQQEDQEVLRSRVKAAMTPGNLTNALKQVKAPMSPANSPEQDEEAVRLRAALLFSSENFADAIEHIMDSSELAQEDEQPQERQNRAPSDDQAATQMQASWRGWLARRHVEGLHEEALMPLKTWFEFFPTGPDAVQMEVRFVPNPRFEEDKYLTAQSEDLPQEEELQDGAGVGAGGDLVCTTEEIERRICDDNQKSEEWQPAEQVQKKSSKPAQSRQSPKAKPKARDAPKEQSEPSMSSSAPAPAGTAKAQKAPGAKPAKGAQAKGRTASNKAKLTGAADDSTMRLSSTTDSTVTLTPAKAASRAKPSQKQQSKKMESTDNQQSDSDDDLAFADFTALPPVQPPTRKVKRSCVSTSQAISLLKGAESRYRDIPPMGSVPLRPPPPHRVDAPTPPSGANRTPEVASAQAKAAALKQSQSDGAIEGMKEADLAAPKSPASLGAVVPPRRKHYGGSFVNGVFVRSSHESVDDMSRKEQLDCLADIENQRLAMHEELKVRKKRQNEQQRRYQEARQQKYDNEMGAAEGLQEDRRKRKVKELKKWLKLKEDQIKAKKEKDQAMMNEILEKEAAKSEAKRVLEEKRVEERERRLKVGEEQKAKIAEQMALSRSERAEKRSAHNSQELSAGYPSSRTHQAAAHAEFTPLDPSQQRVIHRHIHHHVHYHEGNEDGSPVDEEGSPTDAEPPYSGKVGSVVSTEEQRQIEMASEERVRAQLEVSSQAAADGERHQSHHFHQHLGMPLDSRGATPTSESMRRAQSMGALVDSNERTQEAFYRGAIPRDMAPDVQELGRRRGLNKYAAGITKAFSSYADAGRPQYGRTNSERPKHLVSQTSSGGRSARS